MISNGFFLGGGGWVGGKRGTRRFAGGGGRQVIYIQSYHLRVEHADKIPFWRGLEGKAFDGRGRGSDGGGLQVLSICTLSGATVLPGCKIAHVMVRLR